MAISTEDARVVVLLVCMAGQASITRVHLPLMGLVAGLAGGLGVGCRCMKPLLGDVLMAGNAVDHRRRRDVGLVALATIELHGRVRRECHLGLGLVQMAPQAGLPVGQQCIAIAILADSQGIGLRKELMAVKAVILAHRRYLHLLIRVADLTDRRRRGKTVDAHRVALDATDPLLLEMHLVAGGIRNLWRERLTVAVAIQAGVVGNAGVPVHPGRVANCILYDQVHALYRALLVAGVAVDIAVCAAAPQIPGCLHSMAGAAEVGVVLDVVELLKAAVAKESGYHHHRSQAPAS